jgi:NADH:ubiquinone oxidoreductase subunit 6 (subunit J)
MKFSGIIKLGAVVVLVIIVTITLGVYTFPVPEDIMSTKTADLSILFTKFMLAFEVLAVLLTAAMAGAIVLAKKDKKISLKGGEAQ